ncbi:hypothetical protein TELCIR_16870, partial [Teladorsagia circumcincta]
MVRTNRRRQSNCTEPEKNMQKTPSQRFYGLPYVNESGRPDWSLMQRMAVGHCQRLNRDEGFLFSDPAAPGSPYWGSRTTHAYNVLVKLIKSQYSKHGFCEDCDDERRHADRKSNGVANPLPLPYICRLMEDDSHIFCRPDQIVQEIKAWLDTIDFLSFFYGKVMKFDIEAELSTRSHDCCLGDVL